MSWVEVVGYVASALVVVSLAMRSVVRLRFISLAGSLVFVVYALLIGAIPVLLTNAAVALLNVWFLRKEFTAATPVQAVPIEPDAPFLRDFLDAHAPDIAHSQPEYSPSDADTFVRLLTREGLPAGVLIGEPAGTELLVKLDYVTPAFRDSQVARWLFGPGRPTFTAAGFRRLVAHGHTPVHRTYLEAMGFHREASAWVLDL